MWKINKNKIYKNNVKNKWNKIYKNNVKNK